MEKRFYFREIRKTMTLCVYVDKTHRLATKIEAGSFLPEMTSCEWPFDKEYDEKSNKIKLRNPVGI